MNWLCLFCVEAANRVWLFYGYATPAVDGDPGSWVIRPIDRFNGGIRLLQCNRFIDDPTLGGFTGGLTSPQTLIEGPRGQSLRPRGRFGHGGLRG